MKRLISVLATIILLSVITVPAWAEENTANTGNPSNGNLTALLGNKSLVQGSYQLTKNLTLNGDWEKVSDDTARNYFAGEADSFFRADLRYQIGDWFGVKIGGRYDSAPGETIPYGGFDFCMPFGTNNLKLAGYYNYNYEGKNWASYELAWRIEMYQHQYLFAGVRGDGGDGFVPYSYNADNDPEFFLRADFSGQLGKFGINLRPVLYASGNIFADATLRYNLNERTNIALNFNEYYDHDPKLRLGIEHKF